VGHAAGIAGVEARAAGKEARAAGKEARAAGKIESTGSLYETRFLYFHMELSADASCSRTL